MRNVLLLISIFFLLFSCKHELEKPTWDVDLLIPLLNTDMSINNIITDTNIIVESDEGLISLVFQEKFNNLNLDTLLDVKDTLGVTKIILDSLNFDDISITETSRLGDLLGPIGTIAFPHLDTMIIPDMFGLIQNRNIPVDASQYFESMTLYKGYLRINLYNGLPTELANVDISLVDAINNNIIASFNFVSIAPYTHIQDSVFLGGVSINKDLNAILNNVDVLESNGPVIINHWDAIVLTVQITDIGLTNATTIFPEQQVAEILKEHYLNLEEARIEEIKIKKGTVTVSSTSTLPDTGRISYNIPSLTLEGNSFSSLNIVPPNSNGLFTTYNYELDGYTLNLKGKPERIGGDTVNTIYTEFFAFIDSSGGLVNLNQTDSFFSYSDIDIIPEYAKGYLGQDTINLDDEEIEMNLFSKILSGNLNIESSKLTFSIKNYIGADLQLKFNHLSSYNTNTNTNVSANFNFLSQLYDLPRAIELTGTEPILPSTTEIELDPRNMLGILPDKLKSDVSIYLNPYGPHNSNDFLYPEYTIDASLNLEVPLSIIATNLVFIDTNMVEINNNEETIIDRLFLTIDNGIPFDGTIDIIMLDNMNNVIDTLFDNATILSAQLDNNKIVNQSTRSTLIGYFNNDEEISKIITVASFNSQPNDSYVKIYSDYKINISLSAKLKKNIGN